MLGLLRPPRWLARFVLLRHVLREVQVQVSPCDPYVRISALQVSGTHALRYMLNGAPSAFQSQVFFCLLLTPAHVPGAAVGADLARLAALKALQGAHLTAASTSRTSKLLKTRVGRPIASACGSLCAHVLRGGLVLLQCAKPTARALFTPQGQWALLRAVTSCSAAAVLTALGTPWAMARFVTCFAWDTAHGAFALCSGAPCSRVHVLPCCGDLSTNALHILQTASCLCSAELKLCLLSKKVHLTQAEAEQLFLA